MDSVTVEMDEVGDGQESLCGRERYRARPQRLEEPIVDGGIGRPLRNEEGQVGSTPQLPAFSEVSDRIPVGSISATSARSRKRIIRNR